MKKIEEMSFTIDKTKCTFKLYEYEEVVIRKIAKRLGEEPEDAKIRVTKYALHQEYQNEEGFKEEMICETESYATILTIIKDILKQQIKSIERLLGL